MDRSATITIVALPSRVLDAQGVVDDWKHNHDQATVVTSIEAFPQHEKAGLFDFPAPVHVIVEELTAKDFDQLKDSSVDVLVEVFKKPRKTSWPKHVRFVDYSKPTLKDYLEAGEKLGVEEDLIRRIVKQFKNPASVASMLIQASLVDNRETLLLDVFPGDTPPWDITNAIVAGRVDDAVQATEEHCKGKNSSFIIGLGFQLAGYFKKVIAAKHDVAGISSNFFARSSTSLHDPLGASKDISYYMQQLLESQQPHYVIYSMVASIAARFR